MVRRDGAEVRKERIQEIAQFIHRLLHEQEEIYLSKTLAALQYKFGLTKDKIKEYLEILESIEQFIIEREADKIKKTTDGES
jgi:hypothetical protein